MTPLLRQYNEIEYLDAIRQNLSEAVTASDMPQATLCREAGVGASSIRDILDGRAKNPKIATLNRLSRVMNCTAVGLFLPEGIALTRCVREFLAVHDNISICGSWDGVAERTLRLEAMRKAVAEVSGGRV